MKTYSAKPSDIEKKWFLIDATDLVLGRLSAEVSKILRGKDNPKYSPNMDMGSSVIIINAEKVQLTGNKLENHKYYWHTGYPGGIKEISARGTLDSRFPERLIQRSIAGMMPKNALGKKQLSKLYVYQGAEHPHAGQQPSVVDIASYNEKNKKRGDN